jgi:hypothetical protein
MIACAASIHLRDDDFVLTHLDEVAALTSFYSVDHHTFARTASRVDSLYER